MKTLVEQLSAYNTYHTQRITKITHYIGVPFLVFAALIFLGWVHISVPNLFNINLAWLGLVGLLIYYFMLDAILAAGVGVILILLTILAEFVSQPAIDKMGLITWIVCLVIGIAAQAYGHISEKKKPAFLDAFSLALIAPMYLFAELMFELGYRKELQTEVEKLSAQKY
jgi:uncharacterized membrane protein YGL010W